MWRLDVEEMRDLIQGKFTSRTCLDCNGKGYNTFDIDGNLADYPKPQRPEGMTEEEELEWEWLHSRDNFQCEGCEGLGCHIQWK